MPRTYLIFGDIEGKLDTLRAPKRDIRSFSHDLKSNIQVSCNGPNGVVVGGRGKKNQTKIFEWKKSNKLHRPTHPRWRLPIWAIIAQTPPDGYAVSSASANPLI